MIIMKKITILCLLLLGIGLAGLQAQQRIKVKRLPIDTYEAVSYTHLTLPTTSRV